MKIRIRKYKTSDWEAISKIHDESRLDELKGTVDLNAFIPLSTVAFTEGLFGGEILVAEYEQKGGSEVSGFIGFNKKTIDWLYVSPSHYRKGIGKLLMKSALEKLNGEIRIAVLKNNLPAFELYKKMGFVEERIGAAQYESEGILLKWNGKE